MIVTTIIELIKFHRNISTLSRKNYLHILPHFQYVLPSTLLYMWQGYWTSDRNIYQDDETPNASAFNLYTASDFKILLSQNVLITCRIGLSGQLHYVVVYMLVGLDTSNPRRSVYYYVGSKQWTMDTVKAKM
jgi:hypothetical protein